MPIVETSVFINAPVTKVFEIAKDSEQYPEYMKDVQSVTVVERSENRLVADWVGLIPQFIMKVRWRQEEIWDPATFSSTFRQIEGDYSHLHGSWKFEEKDGGTLFSQRLDYEYDVPTLGALIKRVIHAIVVKNLENINEAFRKRAEASAD